MQHPDPEEVIERGRKARELLDSPMFRDTVDTLSNHHLSAIVAAPPGESGKEARDYHHLLHFALSEIGAQLLGYVQAAEEMVKLIGEEDDDI